MFADVYENGTQPTSGVTSHMQLEGYLKFSVNAVNQMQACGNIYTALLRASLRCSCVADDLAISVYMSQTKMCSLQDPQHAIRPTERFVQGVTYHCVCQLSVVNTAYGVLTAATAVYSCHVACWGNIEATAATCLEIIIPMQVHVRVNSVAQVCVVVHHVVCNSGCHDCIIVFSSR